MNTSRRSKKTHLPLQGSLGEKGRCRPLHTTFNTLDNWGHKTHKFKEKDRKEKVIGSWPGTCMQYTQLQTKALREAVKYIRNMPLVIAYMVVVPSASLLHKSWIFFPSPFKTLQAVFWPVITFLLHKYSISLFCSPSQPFCPQLQN